MGLLMVLVWWPEPHSVFAEAYKIVLYFNPVFKEDVRFMRGLGDFR